MLPEARHGTAAGDAVGWLAVRQKKQAFPERAAGSRFAIFTTPILLS